MKLKIEQWLYALFSAFIGGGASGIVTSAVVMGIAPESFNISSHLGNTLKMIGTVFVINGLMNAFYLLKKSPLPEIEDEKPTDKQP